MTGSRCVSYTVGVEGRVVAVARARPLKWQESEVGRVGELER
jgi:hypothetical protein